MPHINVNGLNVYYESKGEGDPLVLIAGYSSDHSIWAGLEQILSKTFRVITFDNRGCGQSDCPDTPYTAELMAEDTVGLMRGLGIESAHIVGHSLGSSIAQILGATYPSQVRKLVLLTPFAVIDVVSNFSLAMSVRHLEEGISRKTVLEVRLPWLFSGAFLASQPKVDSFVEKVLSYEYPQPLVGLKRQLEALTKADTTQILTKIKAPTFILAAERDIISPPLQAEALSEGISDSDVLVVPSAAHLLPVEQPEFCAKNITHFLQMATR